MYTYIPGVLVNAWLVDVLSVCDIISSISKCKVTISWCIASWVGGEVLSLCIVNDLCIRE